MSVLLHPPGLLGIKVDRATATLPQTTTGTLFTVSGGRVILTGIVGEVTTILGAVATSMNLVHTPTVGTVGDINAATVVTSDEVGTLYGISGLTTDTFNNNIAPTSALTSVPRNQLILAAGNIGLQTTANNTGAVKWSLTYWPFDTGAFVTAA